MREKLLKKLDELENSGVKYVVLKALPSVKKALMQLANT